MRVEHWKLLLWGSLSSLKSRSVILRFNGWERGGRKERRKEGKREEREEKEGGREEDRRREGRRRSR